MVEILSGSKIVSRRERKRRIAHTGSQRAVRAIIGEITPGMEIYGIHTGQFSYINLIEDLILQIGKPVDVDIASWTVAKFEIGRIDRLIKNDNVRLVRFLTDRSFQARHPEEYEMLVGVLGAENIRALRCHCKFTVIRNETWNIALRTSMNLNQNRRIENYEISDCVNLADYMKDIVDELFKIPYDKPITRREMGLLWQEDDTPGVDSSVGNLLDDISLF